MKSANNKLPNFSLLSSEFFNEFDVSGLDISRKVQNSFNIVKKTVKLSSSFRACSEILRYSSSPS